MMKQLAKQSLRIFGITLICVVLTACNENMDGLKNHIQSVKARPADPIAPIPQVKTFASYEYDGLTGRDPFRQSISEPAAEQQMAKRSGPQPNFERPREFLERFELDTLTMVGTFSKKGTQWTLIRDREGIVHRVAVGNYMGKNHGRVSSIEETRVALSELISDGSGGWMVRDASIALGEG